MTIKKNCCNKKKKDHQNIFNNDNNINSSQQHNLKLTATKSIEGSYVGLEE